MAGRRAPGGAFYPRYRPSRRNQIEQAVGADAPELAAALLECVIPGEKGLHLVGRFVCEGGKRNIEFAQRAPCPAPRQCRTARIEKVVRNGRVINNAPPQLTLLDIAQDSLRI